MLFKEYLLKEIAEIKNGYPFNSKDYSENGIPIVRITNIEKEVSLTNCLHVTNINKKMEEALIKENSLLIALSGSVGKMGIFKNSERAYLNQRICMVYPKVNYLRQEYLNYFFETLKKEIIRNSYGGTQVNISSKWIESLKIKIPTIAAQDKVTKNLGTIQEIIKDKKIQIEKLNELTKSLFIKFNKNGVEKQLDEVADIIMGQSPLSQSYNIDKKGLPFYQGKTEFGDMYIKESNIYCNSPIKIAEKNDILMSVRAPVGDVNIAIHKSCIGRGLASIRAKKIDYLYLFYLLKEQKTKIEKMGVGSTFKAINKNNISNLEISIVGMDKQDKIKEYLLLIEKLKFILYESLKTIENKRKILKADKN